jgi:hypothetical protein
VKAKIAAKFEPTIPAETSASNSSILLAEIREEIRQKYLDKNRQIALWLTDIARQDGGPSLSQEAISLAKQCANPVLKISDEEEDSFSVDGHFDRQKSLDLSLKATLFRELMDSISSGLDNWMESVIRRFRFLKLLKISKLYVHIGIIGLSFAWQTCFWPILRRIRRQSTPAILSTGIWALTIAKLYLPGRIA